MLATQITFPHTAPVERGSGRCNVLHGAADPSLNLATVRAQSMTDDDRYQAGFDDGFRNRGTRGSLSHYPTYSNGWSAGYKARF